MERENRPPRLQAGHPRQALLRSISSPASPMTCITRKFEDLDPISDCSRGTKRRSSSSSDDGTPFMISKLPEQPLSADSGTGPSLPVSPDSMQQSFEAPSTSNCSRLEAPQRSRDGGASTVQENWSPVQFRAGAESDEEDSGDGFGFLDEANVEDKRSSIDIEGKQIINTPRGSRTGLTARNLDSVLMPQPTAPAPVLKRSLGSTTPAGADSKRPKNEPSIRPLPSPAMLHRSFSESDSLAISACVRDVKFTADGRRYLLLPCEQHKEKPVMCIAPETMAELLIGKYNEDIEELLIVDCRYPYEYDAGHIRGAEHHYLTSTMFQRLFSEEQIRRPRDPDKRFVIIFHCEFSSERGPNMLVQVREEDRRRNQYPNLLYPEMYVLRDGYKEFYKRFKNQHCVPADYLPMSDERYRLDMKKYRSQTRSQGHSSKPSLFRQKSVCRGLNLNQ